MSYLALLPVSLELACISCFEKTYIHEHRGRYGEGQSQLSSEGELVIASCSEIINGKYHNTVAKS